ncbi:Putative Actin family, ATPase, nucleotide binding domain-containing protein [Septoria linicola]|uniref:Actin family, ATPase, nucleotide binding domain-containing protein n=1 Tax=Septoria linicola TaxID=215465 RepID=A0A9Q9AV09_9PEZI|nr:putative Actin family, ATPase, nucleotide binding domain-containing protein [Septoria linicola]USW55344.1 Putative Actin family, ATPase, nucleotide binding domain-containing protein [Septoria linicola]
MAKSKTAPSGSRDRLGKTTLVFDHGAHSIKAGFSTPGSEPTLEDCHPVANCVARSQRDKLTYVGVELDDCGDFGELQIRRPMERGYVVSWEAEKAVWERTILDARSQFKCDPKETNLIYAESPNAPGVLERNADEMVFEEFEFHSLYRTISPALNAYAPSPFSNTKTSDDGVPLECVLVVDSGHSHTTITPLYHGRPLQQAIRRLEIGGKTLTAHLRSLLSRTMDMTREEWISQEIKEDTCYVCPTTQDFSSRLERVWKGGQKDPRDIDASIIVDYVLPDYEKLKRGFPRAHDPSRGAKMRRLGIGGQSEMVLPVGNERFTVPEILFTPSDIGMQQEGVAGTIMQSLEALPKGLWQAFLANVVVVGGTSLLPGFVERLENDLRMKIDDGYVVRIAKAEGPTKNAWLGGARMAQDEELLSSLIVTKAEYLEHGDIWTRRKFAGKVGR